MKICIKSGKSQYVRKYHIINVLGEISLCNKNPSHYLFLMF